MAAVLNGIIGDYLQDSDNELATQMAFFNIQNGQPLLLSQVKETISPDSSRLCIFLHGLVCDETSWRFPDGAICSGSVVTGDYGSFLQRDLPDMTPLYLRYNTGLHISTNGHKLSLLMDSLLNTIGNNRDIVFVCHSMGGLVGRSATHHAMKHQLVWLRHVSTMIFLGTPHGGSYWEKLGNTVSCAAGAVPLPHTKLFAQIGNLRSSGIKDLRYGYVLDEDWADEDPDAWLTNTKKKMDLLGSISYHVVTGTVTKNPCHPVGLVFGDGLVSKSSAEGRSDGKDHVLEFSRKQEDFQEFSGTNHNALQSNLEVYHQIKEWISKTRSPSSENRDHGVLVHGNHLIDAEQEKSEMIAEDFIPNNNRIDQGQWARYRGAAALVQVAVHSGATAVQDVQNEMTDQIYDLVGRITPIAPVVKGVHIIHTGIVSAVYDIIRGINYTSGETLKLAFERLDSQEGVGDVSQA